MHGPLACRHITMHQNGQSARTQLRPTLPEMNLHHQRKNSPWRLQQLRPEPWQRGAPMRQNWHLVFINMQDISRREEALAHESRLSAASATQGLGTDQTDVRWRLPLVSTSRWITNRPLFHYQKPRHATRETGSSDRCMDAKQPRYYQGIHPLYAGLFSLQGVLYREYHAKLDEDRWLLGWILEVWGMQADLAAHFRFCS